MYAEPAPAVDPYSDDYNTVPPPLPVDGGAPRARSRSPAARSPAPAGYRSPYRRRSPPPAAAAAVRRPPHAPIAPNPSNVLGVFGLSIRTQERDLDEEFSRFGRVEKVTIVYDQRQSDRSRGFGFIKMATVEDATRCIQELNGVDLNGRRIRVDYSVTDRPHAPTPGEYMGHRRSGTRDTYQGRDSRDSYRDRDYRDRDRDRRSDRDRDPYGRDNRDSRDWRDRRSPPPSRGGRYSPDRRRRSYSRSPQEAAAHAVITIPPLLPWQLRRRTLVGKSHHAAACHRHKKSRGKTEGQEVKYPMMKRFPWRLKFQIFFYPIREDLDPIR
ncbi:hypothetical protein C8J57DRAFT_1709799 [Mycena rebaudengoi]|nr:hypothetical protein C8J57DRAFT_1709799 [Mycena rebaudengoi]